MSLTVSTIWLISACYNLSLAVIQKTASTSVNSLPLNQNDKCDYYNDGWLVTGGTTDLYKVPDAVPPIHAESYHVVTDKDPSIDGGKFRSILATIYNQSQLAARKHVARYWLTNTVATAVPLSAHPSPLVITTKLAAAILSGRLFGGGALPAQ